MSDVMVQGDFWQIAPDADEPQRRSIREVLADGITADDIKALLRLRHEQPRKDWSAWAFFDEFIPGTGTAPSASSRIDGWAINVWPSGGFITIAYEIKVNRGDFLRELRDPRKRNWALEFSDEFYFVAPYGLIDRAELPAECGLVEVSKVGVRGMYRLGEQRYNLRVKVKPAPRQKRPAPSWALLASVARRACRAENAAVKDPDGLGGEVTA